jgi:hypothetical protein
MAENPYSKKRVSTATGTFANTGTIGLEAINACRNIGGVFTVNISNLNNTRSTALRQAIESSTAGIKIATITRTRRRSSEDASDEDSENWEELHFREVDLLFWDGKI